MTGMVGIKAKKELAGASYRTGKFMERGRKCKLHRLR
jgi:hypothetical protein